MQVGEGRRPHVNVGVKGCELAPQLLTDPCLINEPKDNQKVCYNSGRGQDPHPKQLLLPSGAEITSVVSSSV